MVVPTPSDLGAMPSPGGASARLNAATEELRMFTLARDALCRAASAAAFACVTLLVLATTAHAQAARTGEPRYPVRPVPMHEADEIRLAESAAPAEISSRAAIYVLRASGPVRAREGTNGATCMVARDLHEGSLYPICFDQEGSRTLLQQELMELSGRAAGLSEEAVRARVTAAYASGALKVPTRPAIAYMMSPRQVLFSSPLPEGRRVGSWHPHVMISVPYATPEQFGLAGTSIEIVGVDRAGEPGAQLVVVVPRWSDSTAAGGRP